MAANRGFIFALGALVGGAIGSFYTWKYMRDNYISKDELNEIREVYRSYGAESVNSKEVPSQNASVTHQNAPESILGIEDEQMFDENEKSLKTANKRSGGKVNYSKISSENAVKPEECEHPKDDGEELEPYVISPDDFESSQNEKISVTFYGCGTICDDMDEPIDEAEFFGKIHVADHFGEYEEQPDLVFIRDPKLKLDYEVQRVLITYPEANGDVY